MQARLSLLAHLCFHVLGRSFCRRWLVLRSGGWLVGWLVAEAELQHCVPKAIREKLKSQSHVIHSTHTPPPALWSPDTGHSSTRHGPRPPPKPDTIKPESLRDSGTWKLSTVSNRSQNDDNRHEEISETFKKREYFKIRQGFHPQT